MRAVKQGRCLALCKCFRSSRCYYGTVLWRQGLFSAAHVEAPGGPWGAQEPAPIPGGLLPGRLCLCEKPGPPTVAVSVGAVTMATCRGRHTHIQSTDAAVLQGRGSLQGWVKAETRICSRIFLPLERGISGDVHKTGRWFSFSFLGK